MREFHPVTGQMVSAEKKALARQLRRDMTPEERMLWGRQRDRRLRGHHFRRQHVIRGFVVDFYCDAARLAVEVDGGIHADQTEYDCERDALLGAHGIRVLRISNDDVRTNLTAVLAHISVASEQPAT